jgi:hypothetical protein
MFSGNVYAAISVGMAIENDVDSNGIISVVDGGKVKVAYEVLEDTSKDLHKNDKIQLLRVSDDSIVSSVARGKKKSGTVSIPVKKSEDEQLYVRYVRKGKAAELIATVCKPGDPDFVPLMSIPRASLADLTIRVNAIEMTGLQNRVVVSPSRGDFTSIQSAIDSISDAAADNRYLVKVGPGTYNEVVTMKPFVDIEGSGELVTRITSDAGTTLSAASDAELRSLTVENSGGINAIYSHDASPRITGVTVTGDGLDYGLKLSQPPGYTGLPPVVRDVTVSVTNSDDSLYGVYYVSNPAPAGDHAPTFDNVDIYVNNAAGTSYGFRSSGNGEVSMRNVTIMAISGGAHANGLYETNQGKAIITNVTATAEGGTTSNTGLHLGGSGSNAVVTESRFAGSTHSVFKIPAATALVVASELDGPATDTLTCVASYDASFVALNSSCQ